MLYLFILLVYCLVAGRIAHAIEDRPLGFFAVVGLALFFSPFLLLFLIIHLVRHFYETFIRAH